MSKKILILSASPRKGGNSDILCEEFIGARKKPDARRRKSLSELSNKTDWHAPMAR
ncbi:MAG: NAD(P)H-dependent oxidoreductase [Treponema sp.]|nr:NAD(P)H-dependent oxidoreductase [Treponema sp.]